ncbi:hypothetical protein ABK040_011550 [Willaertia magna]
MLSNNNLFKHIPKYSNKIFSAASLSLFKQQHYNNNNKYLINTILLTFSKRNYSFLDRNNPRNKRNSSSFNNNNLKDLNQQQFVEENKEIKFENLPKEEQIKILNIKQKIQTIYNNNNLQQDILKLYNLKIEDKNLLEKIINSLNEIDLLLKNENLMKECFNYLNEELKPIYFLKIKNSLQGWSLQNEDNFKEIAEPYLEKLIKEKHFTKENEENKIKNIVKDMFDPKINVKFHNKLLQSLFIEFDLQKNLMILFNLANKQQFDLNNLKEKYFLLCFSFLLNESILFSNENLVFKKKILTLFDEFKNNIKLEKDLMVVDPLTNISVNLKTCMFMVKNLLEFNANDLNSYNTIESYFKNNLELDSNNPYLYYYYSYILIKKIFNFNTPNFKSMDITTVEKDTFLGLELMSKLSILLKEKSFFKTDYAPLLNVNFMKGVLHSRFIDLYGNNKSKHSFMLENANQSANYFIRFEEQLMDRPITFSSTYNGYTLWTNLFFGKARALYFARRQQECVDNYLQYLKMMYLHPLQPVITSSTSYYVACMYMLKNVQKAIGVLRQLRIDFPNSLDIKLLEINVKDFSLEGGFVDLTSLKLIVDQYVELEKRIKEEKPYNANILIQKLHGRLNHLISVINQFEKK